MKRITRSEYKGMKNTFEIFIRQYGIENVTNALDGAIIHINAQKNMKKLRKKYIKENKGE